MSSTHPLSWFEARAGQKINRNGKSFTIPTKESAPYCLELQREGFSFSELAKKPKIHISSMPESVCTACEG